LSGMAQDAPTTVGRVFGAGDAVARAAMKAGGISQEDAARYTLSGLPTTPIGQKVLKLWSEYFTLRLMTSLFPRVGIQILERGIERSPVGLLKLKGINEGASAGTRLARAAGGTGAALAGYAANDQAPDWAKPYLVALGGVYGLPAAAGMAVSAASQRGADPVTAGVETVARNLPFPQFGPAETIKQLGSGATLVPNALRDVARARDPFERDTRGDFFGRTKAKIPGLRETLPVRGQNVNIVGQPTENRSTPLRRMLSSASPERSPMQGIPEPVANELQRLDVAINVPAFEKELTVGKRKIPIPPEAAERARAERRQYLVPLIEKLLQSPAYQRADDTGKKRRLEATIRRAEEAGGQRARANVIKTLRQQGAIGARPR